MKLKCHPTVAQLRRLWECEDSLLADWDACQSHGLWGDTVGPGERYPGLPAPPLFPPGLALRGSARQRGRHDCALCAVWFCDLRASLLGTGPLTGHELPVAMLTPYVGEWLLPRDKLHTDSRPHRSQFLWPKWVL